MLNDPAAHAIFDRGIQNQMAGRFGPGATGAPAGGGGMWPAIIAGAATLGSALLASRASSASQHNQNIWNNRAMQFEQRKYADWKASEEARLKAEEEAHAAAEALRSPYRLAANQVFGELGLNVPANLIGGGGMPMGATQPGVSIRDLTASPGTVMAAAPNAPPLAGAPRLTLGNLSRWNQWGDDVRRT